MSFQQYIEEISAKLEKPSLDNLDLLTVFYLGIKAGKEDASNTKLHELTETVKQLHAKKRALKFLERLLVISGSNNLTASKKLEVISSHDPLSIISAVNAIAGRVDATQRLEPYKNLLSQSSFHEEFLEYENNAHGIVVGSLISRLRWVANRLRKQGESNNQSMKNTLKRLYDGNNVGKTFLSIDLRQANWTCLQYWDNKLVSWDKFLDSALPESHIKPLLMSSKNFRQVTLGVALKNLGIVKHIESTQVKITKDFITPLLKFLKQEPFSESNDEVILEYINRQQRNYLLTAVKKNPRFRLTKFNIVEKTHDDCYVISYEELDTHHKYTLLRCSSPEKVESRLK